jgi:hypothetical protein
MLQNCNNNNLLVVSLLRLLHFLHMPSTRIPSAVCLSDAARGLAQQMVWWGHDVRHPSGNALLAYGMERRPSTGLTGTSCYSVPWRGGRVELHGAVASWTGPVGATGCLFSRERGRLDLWPEDRAPVPGREFGVTGSAAERWRAGGPLIAWVVDYENWVRETLGSGWRAGCWQAVKRLPKGKVWLPPVAALQWWKEAVASVPPRPREWMRNFKVKDEEVHEGRC